MLQQIVLPLNERQKYNIEDFIVSHSNAMAFNAISNWPNIWGTHPFKKSLLIIGPKSSGKSFLGKVWLHRNSGILPPLQQILYEDIDTISDEEELLHKFNLAHEEMVYLLLTSSTFPTFSLPDLQSRINSINTLTIAHPDDELIKMLIFKLFSDHSIKIELEIVLYLMKRLPRQFSSIQKAISQINKQALITKRKVTINFIKSCTLHY